MNERLQAITRLSNELGSAGEVLGGGGNTSCKTAETLWIKPSGISLGELTPERFVAVDRAALTALYRLQPPPEPAAREAWVQARMAEAVRPERPGRASVETPLHDSFAATYVVHTHPAWVNGLTCALGGPEAAAELLPGALWIPYTDPGYTLCLRVRRAIEERRTGGTGEPQVVLLGNHGLFVAGNDEEEVRQGYAAVRAPLLRAYAAAGVPVALKIGRAPSPAAVARAGAVLREAFGAEAACLAAAGPCELAAGPLSPDHIVYARAYPYEGALQPTALRAFRARRGYPPRVVIASDAVYGVGPTERVANLALELALDGARVRHLARAFGGAQYLSDVSRAFIEEWEVESYRSRQV